jgi:hypothetical protein
MLKGLVGQQGTVDFPTALEAEVAEIKAEREKKTGAYAVLVVEAHGDIPATFHKPTREYGGFVIAFDAVDKLAVRRTHQSEIEAMKTAVAFETDVPSRFAALGEGTYLIDEEGKIIYSVNFSMPTEATVSTNLSSDGLDRITARYSMLQRANDIESVQRLFSQVADFGADRLKAFLSGWAALEMLIAKSFKTYEQVFLSPLAIPGQPILRDRFLGRIKDVMKDKYRLTDKFVVVAAVLFPTTPDVQLQEDYDKFCRLKKLRDSIFHGHEFSEHDLPIYELTPLLRKYVVAHIATIAQSTPGPV